MRGVPNSDETHSKRTKILEAAYIIFSRKGYHCATVDEIIALADTGKGTVYKYFSNKEQLFYTLIRERSAPFEVELAKVTGSAVPPLVKIEIMVRMFLRFYSTNADLWRVMMHEIRGLTENGNSAFSDAQIKKYHDDFQYIIGLLSSVIQEGIDQGVIRNCNVLQTTHGLFSVIIVMVFHKLVGDDIDATAHGIADIFLYGVAAANPESR